MYGGKRNFGDYLPKESRQCWIGRSGDEFLGSILSAVPSLLMLDVMKEQPSVFPFIKGALMSANNLNQNRRIEKVASGDLWRLGLSVENRKLALKWGCSNREQFDFEQEKRKQPADQGKKSGDGKKRDSKKS